VNDSQVPPGWSYNPSTWGQRLPIVGAAVVGMAIAGYMAAFQFHLIDSVWEPFFGNGTRKVLTSKISNLLPVPDAFLGALGYFADAATGAIGGERRWKRMPWIVIIFGLAVGPLGLASIALVMSQPLVVGHWCTLCLASAVISVVMIGPATDEMLASLQHVKRQRDLGHSTWRVFWGLETLRAVEG
jgi:uncharacterized membrane protein